MDEPLCLETTLPDGTPVRVRTVTPEDAPLLHLGFEQLSDRSRQFRFLRAIRSLGEAELAFLPELAGRSQDALGALDLSQEPPAPVGLVRYVCLPEHPARAEVALTVVDALQGRGLGTLLFGLLAARAVSAGLEGFVALASAENRAMLGLLDELGARRESDHGGELELFLPLRADPRDYPDTPAGRAFRDACALLAAARHGA